MADKPLTADMIALTEKKMDMSLGKSCLCIHVNPSIYEQAFVPGLCNVFCCMQMRLSRCLRKLHLKGEGTEPRLVCFSILLIYFWF